MIDDQTLLEAIDKSPLKPRDKEHWKTCVPKLNSEQRGRFHHSLTAKTEITRAIKLIEKALNIIAEAEAEAEADVKKEEETKKDKEGLLQELEEIKKKEEKNLLDKKQLKQKQEETKTQIEGIRQELRTLSMEVHGQPPPSYGEPKPESLPSLERPGA